MTAVAEKSRGPVAHALLGRVMETSSGSGPQHCGVSVEHVLRACFSCPEAYRSDTRRGLHLHASDARILAMPVLTATSLSR